MYNPIHIDSIYDIFHNGEKLIIIRPAESILDIYANNQKMNVYQCPHQHTFIYTLNILYSPTILLTFYNPTPKKYGYLFILHNFITWIYGLIWPTIIKVNVYPQFKHEIVLSTLVKDEDDYIKPWINFHLHIGITRFIIYDNSNKKKLATLLSEYIKKQQVILISWPYPYRLPISGISGQTTQQNHTIYAFPTCKYIGFFDIDEYINLQNDKNIHDFFNNIIKLYLLNTKQIGSFTFRNKFFYNPDELPITNDDFLQIFNCDTISLYGHEKNFVLPQNVKTFSVHQITDGKPMIILNEKDVYFNHYYYLNKSERGRNKTNQIDSSILKHIKLQKL